MADLRPPIAPALAAFGLPATVTVPGEEPVVTTAIWLPPVAVETPGTLFGTNEPQQVLAIPATAFPVDLMTGKRTVTRGTRILIAEQSGGAVGTWMVETVIAQIADEVRVTVIRTEAE